MACFLVTGGAGFIGSNLVVALVKAGHSVRVLDDYSTGRPENLRDCPGTIEVFEGSICDRDLVAAAMAGVDFCLHQAAVPSVPRSIKDPWKSNRANVEGSINVFLAARDAGVKRVVFASSSSVYGRSRKLPLREDQPVNPISPYGTSKAAAEFYARVFADLYGLDIVGLRYFNVFGPRQDPTSQYAAVVPNFISRMLTGESPEVDGDGRQARDFSFIENVISANLKACLCDGPLAGIYNVACGTSTSILGLVEMLNAILGTSLEPIHRAAREGDIRDSLADITRAGKAFGYEPVVDVETGLRRTVAWYSESGCA